MITCDYAIKDSSGEERIISNDQLYNILSRATGIYKTSIDEVLFSRADKQNSRTKILEEIKNQGKLDSKKSNSLLDGDVSYSGENGEYSISSFIDSPLFTLDSVYQKRNIDDYRTEEFNILTAGHKPTDPDWKKISDEANKKIENTIKNWDKIAEDSKILHQLCVDYSIGFHEKDWDSKKQEFVRKALTIIKPDSPFRNVELLEKLYVTFATFYRNIKGLYPDGDVVRNLGLTAKLKDIDSKIFGHIDYAFIDKSGNLHIYNFKVTTQNPSKWAKAKKDKFKLEGAFIKQLLIANGINVSNIGEIEYNIVPLRVYYSEDFSSINKIIYLPPEKTDYKDDQYIGRKQDNAARQYVETPFNLDNINESDLNESDRILSYAFPFMKVASERIFKSTLDWIKEAPSVSETDSLVIKEVNEDDCRYRVILYGETYDIKDFTKKESNQEIIKLVQKHLNQLNSELGDYSSKIANSVERAFKHNSHYLEELQNSSFVSGILAKYLPIDKDTPSKWKLNTDLIEYNILLFKHEDTDQIDIVDITSEDLQQKGDFRQGATNILGSYKLDGNREASTLKGDMGNVELIRTIILLNQILPSLGESKLGEVIVLSTAKNGQSRRHYVEQFNNQYFKDFLRIIKKENSGKLDTVNNNISKANFVDFFDDVINTYNDLMEGLSDAQKNTFEQMGFSELATAPTKVQGLFNILQNLSEYLKRYSPEEIYDIAHPRYGKSSNIQEQTAAQLYELVSRAYQYYTGQLPKYEDRLSYIDINSFTAPTIPDENVRIVVNNMQTTLDSIAYEENQEYEKEISPIVMEYYKACGYTDIQNLTIGNQLHLFDNLYQKDNPMMMFKNPYDESNDLKPHERLFLKKVLFYINKVKESRFLGSKHKFNNYNDPKISEYINNDKQGESYLWVPLTRASKATQRQQNISSRIERIKRAFKIAGKSEHWYSEIISNMTQDERTLMDESIKALSLKNSFDIGDLDATKRANYLAKNGQAIFETNVENIMLEYMAKAKETEKLNKFLVGTKALLFQLHIMGNDSNEAREIVEKESKLIKEYITQNAFNTSTMDPTNQKIVAMASGLKQGVTFLNLAGNMVSFFRDIINGFGENFLRSATKFQTDIKAKSLKDAYEYVIVNGRSNAMNINLLSKLNIRYRLSNTDLARIKERLRTGRNGVYNWDNWAYSTLRSPDFLNRMTLFVARCMQDGVWDAYSMENGELKYDVNRDQRFQHFLKDEKDHPDYKKEKALFILHVNNWNKEHPDRPIDWASKTLPEPYSDQEILSIKNVANNIYGSYDKSLKAQYEHTALGWAFGMYTTWMNGFYNNWFMKPGQYNINRMETEIETDENGNQIYMDDYGNLVTRIQNNDGSIIFIDKDGNEIDGKDLTPVLKNVPIIVQGIWYTLKDAFQIIRQKDGGGLAAAYKYIQSNEVDKRNMKQAIYSLLVALLFMLLFTFALTPAYKDSKKKSSDLNLGAKLLASISYRSLNGARDSFAGPLNIVEYFGEQLNPPLYKVPVKLISDTSKTIFGDKTFKQLITGNIAIARTYKDIV